MFFIVPILYFAKLSDIFVCWLQPWRVWDLDVATRSSIYRLYNPFILVLIPLQTCWFEIERPFRKTLSISRQCKFKFLYFVSFYFFVEAFMIYSSSAASMIVRV